jgi:hypothetical protein
MNLNEALKQYHSGEMKLEDREDMRYWAIDMLPKLVAVLEMSKQAESDCLQMGEYDVGGAPNSVWDMLEEAKKLLAEAEEVPI